VLLADDQTLVREAFAMLVESARDMQVVGQAATGRQAVELARSERADLVVMDIRMPDLDGIEATRRITADEDLAGVRVLVLTTYDTDEYIVDALRAGAFSSRTPGARAATTRTASRPRSSPAGAPSSPSPRDDAVGRATPATSTSSSGAPRTAAAPGARSPSSPGAGTPGAIRPPSSIRAPAPSCSSPPTTAAR
jgi:CheY-like chemotaxis protein